VAVAPDGQTAWVADTNNHRVAVWTKTGPTTWDNVTTFGSFGAGSSEFDEPFGVAVSANGETVWVGDRGNDRVAVWTKTEPTGWANLTTFGSLGSGPGQFDSPSGVALSADGETIWVSDRGNDRVSVWTKTGPTGWANLTTFGSLGSGPGQFDSPSGVALSADGETVWVSDRGNDRVAVWTKTGPTGWANLTTFGSLGSGPGQFDSPSGVALSADGETIWVSDRGNHRVSVWTKTGPTDWANLTTFGSLGSGLSQFNVPSGVAVAPGGQTVWVVDSENGRVSIWDAVCPA
jgi:DNA-binding beta-propeller fold protein YncE